MSDAPDTFDLIRRWLEYLDGAGRHNANTRAQYRRYLLRFLADVLKPLGAVTEDDVIAVLAQMDPKGAMRGMTLRALRSFYRWAEERDVFGLGWRNPVKRLSVPPARLGPAPTLTDDELARLLKAAERVDPRARWALQLAYATGARVGSLVAVTPQDIRGDSIVFRVAKYDLPYQLPLGPLGQQAVRELLGLLGYIPPTVKARRPTLVGVGERTVWRWCKLSGEIAGVKAWPHLLRHTFASHLARDPDVDIRTWVEFMNHRDPALLRRYSAPYEDRMRRAAI